MVPWQIKVHCWSGTRWQPHLSRLQGPQLIQSHISHRESKMYSLPSQGTLIWWCSLTFFLVVMVSWLGGGWTAHLKNNMFVKLDQISPSFKVKMRTKTFQRNHHQHYQHLSTRDLFIPCPYNKDFPKKVWWVYRLSPSYWSWWIDLPWKG